MGMRFYELSDISKFTIDNVSGVICCGNGENAASLNSCIASTVIFFFWARIQLSQPRNVDNVAWRARIRICVADIEPHICRFNDGRPIFQGALSCPEQSEHDQIHRSQCVVSKRLYQVLF